MIFVPKVFGHLVRQQKAVYVLGQRTSRSGQCFIQFYLLHDGQQDFQRRFQVHDKEQTQPMCTTITTLTLL